MPKFLESAHRFVQSNSADRVSRLVLALPQRLQVAESSDTVDILCGMFVGFAPLQRSALVHENGRFRRPLPVCHVFAFLSLQHKLDLLLQLVTQRVGQHSTLWTCTLSIGTVSNSCGPAVRAALLGWVLALPQRLQVAESSDTVDTICGMFVVFAPLHRFGIGP